MRALIVRAFIGAVVGGCAATIITAIQLDGEQLGGVVTGMVLVAMIPASFLVAVVTVSGFRVGLIFAAGRSLPRRASTVAGTVAAALFAVGVLGMCTVLVDGFAASFFAVPVAISAAFSTAGGVIARWRRPSRPAVVVPLAPDWGQPLER